MVIVTLIALIAVVSILLGLEKWNNVVSDNRNDIVFEGRNHAYGAYQIRKEHTRLVALIVGGMILASASALGIKLLLDMKGTAVEAVDAKLDMTQIDLTPPVDKNEPPPPPPPPPPPVQETVKFTPPVIKDNAVEDEPPPPQEKLEDKQAGQVTQEGTGDENLVVPQETGTGPVEEKAPEVFTVVEEMPGFPGGMGELMKYITKNIQYPQVEKEADIQGTCYVKFVVEADGSVSNVEIARGVKGGPGLDKEAIRVVKGMPKWTIGKQNGRPVRVLMNLPIKFQLK